MFPQIINNKTNIFFKLKKDIDVEIKEKSDFEDTPEDPEHPYI